MNKKEQNIYNYLIELGFKDITNNIIKELKNSPLKSFKSVLERIESSPIYYILEKNGQIGFYTTWYVTQPERAVVTKLTGKPTEHSIRLLLSPLEDGIYCDLANGRPRRDLMEATILALTKEL